MAAREVECLESIDTALAVDPEPAADGVIVEQKGVRNLLAAPAAIQQQDGVGPACHAMFLKAVPRNARQPSPVVLAEEVALDHRSAVESNSPSPSTPAHPHGVGLYLGPRHLGGLTLQNFFSAGVG